MFGFVSNSCREYKIPVLLMRGICEVSDCQHRRKTVGHALKDFVIASSPQLCHATRQRCQSWAPCRKGLLQRTHIAVNCAVRPSHLLRFGLYAYTQRRLIPDKSGHTRSQRSETSLTSNFKKLPKNSTHEPQPQEDGANLP